MWSTSQFSHGFLIIPVALWLGWKRRAQVTSLDPCPTFWALLPLGLLGFTWLLGNITTTAVVQQFCLVVMLIVIVWGMLGTAVTVSLLFPLAFMLFAVPLGEGLIPTLQDLTASLSVRLLNLSGIPVLLEGHVLSVPSGNWEVGEACSGISYLFSSMALGFLYAGLAYQSWSRRVLFFFASAIVPILANSLRVYTIILIASLGGSRIAFGIEHYLYGWLFFAIIIGLLFALAYPWREDQRKDLTLVSKESLAPNLQVTRRPGFVGSAVPLLRLALFAILALLVVGIAPFSARLLARRLDGREILRPMPPTVSPTWKAAEHDAYTWKPHFTAPGAEFTQSYESGEHAVKLYVAYYGSKQPNIKLVSLTDHLFDAKRWWKVGETSVALAIDGQSFRVHQTTIRSGESLLVVWNWIWVDGKFTSDNFMAKALLARARFLNSRCGSAAIALATAERSPQPIAEGILRDFLSHLSFQDTLRSMSADRSLESCATGFTGSEK